MPPASIEPFTLQARTSVPAAAASAGPEAPRHMEDATAADSTTPTHLRPYHMIASSMRSISCWVACLMRSRYRVKYTPDGAFDPWMLSWQLTQLRLYTREVGPVEPGGVYGLLLCPELAWHC